MKTRILLALATALLISACDDNKSSPIPIGTSPTVDLTFQFSPGMAGQCTDFDFPAKDGVHYCTRMPQAIQQGQKIKITYTVTGDPAQLKISDPGEGPPATLHLYFQRQGDNMSGQGAYQQFRYWAGRTELTPGQTTIIVPLDPSQWTDVYGATGTLHPDGFAAAIAQMGVIGITFGGKFFAGHGVYGLGVHFHVDDFEIVP